MPCTARNGRITLKARRGRTLRRRIAVDGEKQLRALGVDGRCPLAGLCSNVIAFAGTQRDVIGISLQQRKQCLRRLSRHLFFFNDSPCARVTSAMPGVDTDPIRRVANDRPKRLPCLIPARTRQCSIPEQKRCAKADDTHQKADDRRGRWAALFPSAGVFWI